MKSILFSRISLFLVALLSTLLISLSSCDKKNGEDPQPTIDSIKQVLEDEDEEEEDELPPYYFKAKYNGIDWEADTCFFNYNSSIRPDTVEFMFYSESDTLNVQIFIQVPLADLSGGCIPNSEFTYASSPHFLNTMTLAYLDPVVYPGAGQIIYTGMIKEGSKVVITGCNYSNRTITGTFNYIQYRNGIPGDTMRLADGQFRIPLWAERDWFN